MAKVKQLKSPENRMAVVPKIEVFFNTVVTSAHNEDNKSKLVLSNNKMSSKQVVVAAGPNAAVKVGDWIQINVDMFPKKQGGAPKHDIGQPKTIIIPPLYQIGSTKYLYLTDRHIMWKIEKDDSSS